MNYEVQHLVNDEFLLWLKQSNNLDNRQVKLEDWFKEERLDENLLLAYMNIEIEAKGRLPMIKNLLEYTLFTGKLYQHQRISENPDNYLNKDFLYHIDIDMLQEKPQ
jgi:hypothetical protein